MRLLGSVDGTADASWTGAVNKIHARADLVLKAAPVRDSAAISNGAPAGGIDSRNLRRPEKRLAFRQTSLRIPSTTIALQGEVSNRSNLQLQANTSDLHQIATLFSAVRGGQPSASWRSQGRPLYKRLREAPCKNLILGAVQCAESAGARQPVEQREVRRRASPSQHLAA